MVLSRWHRWFKRQAVSARSTDRQVHRGGWSRPCFELLEERSLPTTLFGTDSAGLIFPTNGPTLTTTALTSSPNASVLGQPATFTAVVATTPHDSGTPTGSVAFEDGSATLGTALLDTNGVARFTTTLPLAVGSHAITAVYSGDEAFAPSTSSVVNQIVRRGVPGITLQTATNPSVFSQPIRLTVTVTGSVGMPTGSVTFLDGSADLGTAPLDSSGLASFTAATFSPGIHTITAQYNGDPNFTPDTAQPLTQTVNPALAAVAVGTATQSAPFGQPVTFTAAVSPLSPATSTPIGGVAFQDGTTALGTGMLDPSGHATLTTAALAAGTHTISAHYVGDADFLAADSPTLTQTVDPEATAVTVTASANPSPSAQPVLFTAAVRTISPGGDTPTGAVTFQDGTTVLGTVHLDRTGTATVSAQGPATGQHSITAVYEGDGNFARSTSSVLKETILGGPNEAFVRALYHDVLQRTPDAAGLQFWVQQLQAGASRTAVATAFETSVEYRGLEVDRIYQSVLHRAADPAGRALWVNALVEGHSESDVVVTFLTSAEYTAAHRDDASYVTGLYQDVLNHAADPAGAASWQAILQGGVQNRRQVALAFLGATEAYLQAIDSYYTDFLGRSADPVGRQAYLMALQNGAFTPTGITTTFLASDEFLDRAIRLVDQGELG